MSEKVLIALLAAFLTYGVTQFSKWQDRRREIKSAKAIEPWLRSQVGYLIKCAYNFTGNHRDASHLVQKLRALIEQSESDVLKVQEHHRPDALRVRHLTANLRVLQADIENSLSRAGEMFESGRYAKQPCELVLKTTVFAALQRAEGLLSHYVKDPDSLLINPWVAMSKNGNLTSAIESKSFV